MDNGSYWRIWYSSNHKISRCGLIKGNAHSITAWYWMYETNYWIRRQHRRQISYPASHYSPPLQSLQSPPRTFNKTFHDKWRITRYVLRHITGSNSSYSSALANLGLTLCSARDLRLTIRVIGQTFVHWGCRRSSVLMLQLTIEWRYCTNTYNETKEEVRG